MWCLYVLVLKKYHIIKLKMGIGKGIKIVAELLSLWGLLWFAKKRGADRVEYLW